MLRGPEGKSQLVPFFFSIDQKQEGCPGYDSRPRDVVNPGHLGFRLGFKGRV